MCEPQQGRCVYACRKLRDVDISVCSSYDQAIANFVGSPGRVSAWGWRKA